MLFLFYCEVAMRRMARLGILFAILAGFQNAGYAQGNPVGIEQSVVKIVNQYNRFSWYEPWASGATGKGTGSGFVISGKRIMTNAHVVSDSALILVYFHNDPQPYPAHVAAIGHDCDLAILELEDPARIEEVPALALDGLPELRSRVVTYGYPMGGQLISSTVGVVSRIEQQTYVHSGVDSHLAVQTDAAINPGNSGGPVVQNGKVVGVAFQGNSNLENMGFFIPIQVVGHFLADLEDGTYDGYPEFGILASNLENPAARAYAGMEKGETGIRVDYIIRGGSAEGTLQTDDILTAIDGYPVANDGTIVWHGLRLDSSFAIDQKQMGDTVPLRIIRGSKRMEVSLQLNHYNPGESKAHLYDCRPNYYVYAGLVFVPLNRESLKSYSDNWVVDAPQELIYESYYRPLIEHDFLDTPHVIQIRRLDAETNVEEARHLYRVIESVNGQPVGTLPELVDAFEGNTNAFHVIRFKYDNRITVLDREKSDAANQQILNRYAIPKDRRL